MNMDLWVVDTSNRLFIRRLWMKIKKKQLSKNSVLCDRSILKSSLASDRAVLYGNVAFSILVVSTKKMATRFSEKGVRFFRKFVSKLNIENVQNF